MKPVLLKLSEIRSHWHDNIQEGWQPEQGYIDYLEDKIKNNEYLPPIIVVAETSGYVVVNGHHRIYAQLRLGNKHIKAFVLDGTFKDTEPLRRAEGLLKEYDGRTKYKYKFCGYLDRWAAAAENHGFVNKYRSVYRISVFSVLQRLIKVISNRKR